MKVVTRPQEGDRDLSWCWVWRAGQLSQARFPGPQQVRSVPTYRQEVLVARAQSWRQGRSFGVPCWGAEQRPALGTGLGNQRSSLPGLRVEADLGLQRAGWGRGLREAGFDSV